MTYKGFPRWQVYRHLRTGGWVALSLTSPFRTFPTWREAMDYADREARR